MKRHLNHLGVLSKREVKDNGTASSCTGSATLTTLDQLSKLLWTRSSRNSSRHSLPQQRNDASTVSSVNRDIGDTDSSQHSGSDADLRLEYTKSFALLPSFHRDRRPSSRLRHPRSDARSLDPQGLSILYTPPSLPSADIIFVHGLGGSSRLTWAKDHDISLFWPLEWLPLEDGISSARISSFGYDAQFKSQQQRGYLSISDFAKDLLYQMRYTPNDDSMPVPLGEVGVAEQNAASY